ncbi:Uma2 family endonuclease [Pseudoflavonifractor sp. 60]|uniref:Uma2 family endonuclease n=1 Tax=Pseudoflavonifractor sp. 60 TaxID=2304576 RepID=UPI00136D93C2|nr:Uma2 family endonuclease [Pseudoflavonifractor sp. 60]NBI69178.1 Uma2 family endonuclease [Pseudoflavonifractor sp. 60]
MALPAEEIRYTFADVLTWNEGDRIEIIDGEAFMMSPPLTDHQRICGGLFAQLYNYLKDKSCEVFPAPFGVRLFERGGDAPEDVDTMVEPDITVVCDKSKLDKYGCKGAPDLVIEVLSPSTRRHDKMVKFDLYQKAGVRELWLVDPEAREVQTFLLDGGRYFVNSYGTAEDSIKAAVLEDCVIELSSVFPE